MKSMACTTRLFSPILRVTHHALTVHSRNKTLQQYITPLACSCIIQVREYKPYTRLPKAYQKKKDRNKVHRDDVYFLTDQAPQKHTLDDAVNAIRAYDLFGPEEIDILIQVNMGQGKDRIGVLKGLVNLPKPVSPAQKVLVFAEGELAELARQAGADIVGGIELIQQVEEGELEFDHCLCTLDFLPNIKHLPKILRNKMPNTRRGTATNDLVDALKTYSQGESYVADNSGNIRQTLARTDFTNSDIKSNVLELTKTIGLHKTVAKEKFFLQASLIIPPGPKIDLHVIDIVP